MKVDLEDVMFWMDAVRDSDDRYRTLESFWKGQLRSKVWLVERLEEMLATHYNKKRIIIHGGWNGVLASLLFNSRINIGSIRSLDIDPKCEKIATTINKRQEMEGRFEAVTADMTMYDYDADVVINTSCEHLTNGGFRQWLNLVPEDAIIVLQSNNYFELEEHINCAIDLEDFIKMTRLPKVLWAGEYETPKYNRFMIIGKKA